LPTRYLGIYDDVEDAARAYAKAYLDMHDGVPPSSLVQEETAEEAEEVIDLEPFRSKKSTTGFRGVVLTVDKKKFKAQKNSEHLGNFETAEEAARAYARVYLKQHGKAPEPIHEVEFKPRPEIDESQIDLEQFKSIKCQSGFRGVYPKLKKFQARITVPGPREQNLGHFDTAEEAAMVFAKAFLRLHGTVPTKTQAERHVVEDDEEIDLAPFRSTKARSGWKGVYITGSRFGAKVAAGDGSGDDVYLGLFDTPERAARAYAKAFYEMYKTPPSAKDGGGVDEEDIDIEVFRTRRNATGYRGVSFKPERNTFIAQTKIGDGPVIHLGSYQTKEGAAMAYAKKYIELHGVLPQPSQYGASGPLPDMSIINEMAIQEGTAPAPTNKKRESKKRKAEAKKKVSSSKHPEGKTKGTSKKRKEPEERTEKKKAPEKKKKDDKTPPSKPVEDDSLWLSAVLGLAGMHQAQASTHTDGCPGEQNEQNEEAALEDQIPRRNPLPKENITSGSRVEVLWNLEPTGGPAWLNQDWFGGTVLSTGPHAALIRFDDEEEHQIEYDQIYQEKDKEGGEEAEREREATTTAAPEEEQIESEEEEESPAPAPPAKRQRVLVEENEPRLKLEGL